MPLRSLMHGRTGPPPAKGSASPGEERETGEQNHTAWSITRLSSQRSSASQQLFLACASSALPQRACKGMARRGAHPPGRPPTTSAGAGSGVARCESGTTASSAGATSRGGGRAPPGSCSSSRRARRWRGNTRAWGTRSLGGWRRAEIARARASCRADLLLREDARMGLAVRFFSSLSFLSGRR